MAEPKRTGLGTLPAGLIRPTVPTAAATPAATPPPEPSRAAESAETSLGDDLGETSAEGQGRGERPIAGRVVATRKKRAPAGGETRGRKLQLPDDLHDRLWLLARQRRKTVSAIAAEILDRNLPRFTITKEG